MGKRKPKVQPNPVEDAPQPPKSDAISEFMLCAAMLSNIAYNCKQQDRIPTDVRKSCEETQIRYDAALPKFRAEIDRLRAEVAAKDAALDKYECWGRDMVNDDDCWPDGPDGLPTLTQALYIRFLEIRPTGKTFGEKRTGKATP